MRPPLSERTLVLLIGAGQLVVTLAYAMILPLGPDLARDLGIPSSNLGFVGGSYVAAAGLAGLAGTFYLDRFDRRRALALALAGVVAGSIACGLATGFVTLLAARSLAGAAGGQATALALAIVSDAVAPARRGRALGSVMSSFAVSSVLGVPAGIELARLAGWRAPFFTVAALGAAVTVAGVALLPQQRAHLAERGAAPAPFREVLSRPVAQLSILAAAVGVIANFALVPNLSAYLQFNRGYPRDELGLLYLLGGAIAFGTLRLAGWLTDRHGAPSVTLLGGAAYAAVLVFGFIYPVDVFPVSAVFVCFMVAQGFRLVPMHALTSRIPAPHERARFMSAQSAVKFCAAAAGGILGAQLLDERADGSLTGIDHLAWFALAMALVHPVISYAMARRLEVQVSPTI